MKRPPKRLGFHPERPIKSGLMHGHGCWKAWGMSRSDTGDSGALARKYEKTVRNFHTAVALICEVGAGRQEHSTMNEQTLFAEALERTDPQERATYLDQACQGDAALRQRIERLLAQHEHAGKFLESSPPKLTA